MSALIGAFLGAVLGLGLLMITIGWRGTANPIAPREDPATDRLAGIDRLTLRLVIGFVVALFVYALTGWPVGSAIAFLFGAIVPSLVGAKAARRAEIVRIEAIAVWTEQLRDTMAAASGLQEAIASSARVAPAPIRTEVEELARRLRREPLDIALKRFAAELAHPAADQVVVELILASERQAGNLGEVLSTIAKTTRESASMRMRIETSRARTYAQARFVSIVTGALVGALLLLNRDYLAPYGSATGQIVLLVIGGLFLFAAYGIVRMSRVEDVDRVLGGVADEVPA